MYILQPAPAVMSAGYTEPIFALLTFSALYLAIQRRYLSSALLMACGTAVRATGILSAAVLAWWIVFPTGLRRTAFRPPVCISTANFSQ